MNAIDPLMKTCIRLRGGPADGTLVHHVCEHPGQLPVAWVEPIFEGTPLIDETMREAVYIPLYDPPGYFYRTPDGEMDFAPGMRAVDNIDGGHDHEHSPQSRCVVYTFNGWV